MKAFLQGEDRRLVALENHALVQQVRLIPLVTRQFLLQSLFAGQETALNAVADAVEAQVEAVGLHLLGFDRGFGANDSLCNGGAYPL